MKKKLLLLFVIFTALVPLDTYTKARELYHLYFSPEGGVEKKLITQIEEEKESLLVAIYSLTHKEIVDALIRAKNRGVDVALVIDPYSLRKHTPVPRLIAEGIEVNVWKGERRKAKGRSFPPIMHHKFCVFGNHSVWTGSFNFTNNAAYRNCENAILIHDKKAARSFKKEFYQVKEGCLDYDEYIEKRGAKTVSVIEKSKGAFNLIPFCDFQISGTSVSFCA